MNNSTSLVAGLMKLNEFIQMEQFQFRDLNFPALCSEYGKGDGKE